MRALVPALIGLAGMGLLVLVHELGHFLAALAFGVEVQVLSFGFGPALLKWGRRWRCQLCVIPIGGYCKFKGEDDLRRALARRDRHLERVEEGSIYAAHPAKRMLMYFAGPLSNWLFALVCFTVLLLLPVLVPASEPRIVLSSDYPALYPDANRSAAEAGLKTGDLVQAVDGEPVATFSELRAHLAERKEGPGAVVRARGRDFQIRPEGGLFGLAEFVRPEVATVFKDSPEHDAGLRNSDLIVSIDGRPVGNMLDILLLCKEPVRPIDMGVARQGRVRHIFYTPAARADGLCAVGFTLKQEGKLQIPRSLGEALALAAKETVSILRSDMDYVGSLARGEGRFGDTVAGTLSASSSIGELTSLAFDESRDKGLRIAFLTLAVVSISLALVNLLPLPSLDGGLIILSLAELIRGRNASPKVYLAFQILGFVVMAAAFVLVRFA